MFNVDYPIKFLHKSKLVISPVIIVLHLYLNNHSFVMNVVHVTVCLHARLRADNVLTDRRKWRVARAADRETDEGGLIVIDSSLSLSLTSPRINMAARFHRLN